MSKNISTASNKYFTLLGVSSVKCQRLVVVVKIILLWAGGEDYLLLLLELEEKNIRGFQHLCYNMEGLLKISK